MNPPIELTDEQLRIRIAEFCGWTRIDKGTFGLRSGKDLLGSKSELGGTPPCDKNKPENDQSFAPIPNYPTSLDAMHEAEKLIDQMPIDSKSLWLDYLALECGWVEATNHHEAQFISHYNTARATARQRAIALVRTISQPIERKEG